MNVSGLDEGTPKHEHTWILLTVADSLSMCTVEKLKQTISHFFWKRVRRFYTTSKTVLC